MRPLVAVILSCALASVAAGALPPPGVCPDGQCPAPVVPGGAYNGQLPAQGQPPIDAQAIARIINQVGTSRSLGSGTLIDAADGRGLVLTCAHLFRDGAGTIWVRFPNREAFAARLLRIDSGADLAVLAIAAPGIQPVELASEFPQRGDPLVSCGYGSDGRLGCNRGQALGYVTTMGSHGRETLELSGAARMGDSGGPVLDNSGQLVAVLFGTDGRVVNGTFCGRIRRFLRGLSPRFGRRGAAQPRRQPKRLTPVVPPAARKPRPPAKQQPARPERLAPADVESPGRDTDSVPSRAPIVESWLTTKLTALLVSFGVPGGIAGATGGVIVWLAMRRAKRRLQAELDRLQRRPGERSDSQRIDRHHNQYVPYEAGSLDKAWAAAHARVGERYPGAVPYLRIAEGVKDQLLSGNEEPQRS